AAATSSSWATDSALRPTWSTGSGRTSARPPVPRPTASRPRPLPARPSSAAPAAPVAWRSPTRCCRCTTPATRCASAWGSGNAGWDRGLQGRRHAAVRQQQPAWPLRHVVQHRNVERIAADPRGGDGPGGADHLKRAARQGVTGRVRLRRIGCLALGIHPGVISRSLRPHGDDLLMPAGLEIKNNSGVEIIGPNAPNFAVIESGVSSVSVPTFNSLTEFVARRRVPSTSDYYWYKFGRATPSANFGLQLFDASGQLQFCAATLVARVVDVFEAPAWGQPSVTKFYPSGRDYAAQI